jgi:tetratricopeptide (TPR) repeat protein
MPFGKKPDAAGSVVDFDKVYEQLIAPSIRAAGMEPLRADEEMTGGIIHKPMFERLILCEFAVADLTTANANVFYELGVRHAVRPWSTILLFSANGSQLPFDVRPLRAIPYTLTKAGAPAKLAESVRGLTKFLRSTLEASRSNPSLRDSPLYELVEDYPNVQHEKTDVFRTQVQYSAELKREIAAARVEGAIALRALKDRYAPIKNLESAVVIDLFLSYRAVKAWKEMISLVDEMPAPLSSTVMVQEQLALALNRDGRGEEAERVLKNLLAQRGPSSETYGILGRVYKDRWEKATKDKDEHGARGLLREAINAYLQGFEIDWRDPYPGINAVTLMEVHSPPDPRGQEIIPVVAYCVKRRIATGQPDYWDYATMLELAVLAKNEQEAMNALADALPRVREVWEPETSLRNLRLIREAREQRKESLPWMKKIEAALQDKMKRIEEGQNKKAKVNSSTVAKAPSKKSSKGKALKGVKSR